MITKDNCYEVVLSQNVCVPCHVIVHLYQNLDSYQFLAPIISNPLVSVSLLLDEVTKVIDRLVQYTSIDTKGREPI